MTLGNGGTLILGLLLAGWTGAAIWALITGLEMRRSAAGARRQLRRLSRLLEGAPALPLIVRADGRIEGPDRLARWFGLQSLPPYLRELGEGLDSETFEALGAAIAAAQKAGKPFATTLTVAGSGKTLRIEGQLADAQTVAAGAAALWVFDTSDAARRNAALEADAAAARRAFDALSGLIEAAPMPMWFRTPDLRLSLVNSAYVHAVGGESAEAVIAGGLELVEPVDGVSAQAAAARALEGREPLARTVSATVAGQRRTLDVVDLPLGDRGIAGYAIDTQDLQQARQALARFLGAQRDMLDHLSAGVVQFDRRRRLVDRLGDGLDFVDHRIHDPSAFRRHFVGTTRKFLGILGILGNVVDAYCRFLDGSGHARCGIALRRTAGGDLLA